MVEMEEPGQVWHIGGGAFRIGTAFLRRTKIAERARGAMDQLMRDTGETANLGMEAGGEVLFLAQVETYEAIRAFFPPGTKGPMHVSGIGKALLAWYPPEKVADILKRKGFQRFTTCRCPHPKALTAIWPAPASAAMPSTIRNAPRACAASRPRSSTPMAKPVAGLSVSGPAFRISLSDTARIGALVRAAADQVTAATGGAQP